MSIVSLENEIASRRRATHVRHSARRAGPLLLAILWAAAGPAPAATLSTIPTAGHDQDIVYEAGLTNGQIGATGEIGNRQFYETGIYTVGLPPTDRGLPLTLPPFTSSLAPNVIDYAFQPFEESNILKFDATTAPTTAKALDLTAPASYSDLAIVFSASGVNAAPSRFSARLGYTINYVGGTVQSGQFTAADWGDVLVPAGIEKLFNADRTGASTPPPWPVAPDSASASSTRWSIYAGQVTSTSPNLTIESVSFNAFLSDGTNVSPLTGDMDVVVFGLAGSRSPTLALEVDTVTGQVRLFNPTIASAEINGYELASTAGSLNLAGWNSLSDQNLDAVDGPDVGTAAGNGIGETWDEAAGSSSFALQEGFLFGSTILPAGGSLSLGAAFDTAVNVRDLSFKYRRTDGALTEGSVTYFESAIPGDFDADADVDGEDLMIWNANFGSTSADPTSGDANGDGDADGRDFLVWQRNLTGSLASQAIAAVPEPSALTLAAAACLVLATCPSQSSPKSAARCTSYDRRRGSFPRLL
jgi:hypothetical protein